MLAAALKAQASIVVDAVAELVVTVVPVTSQAVIVEQLLLVVVDILVL